MQGIVIGECMAYCGGCEQADRNLITQPVQRKIN